LHVELVHNCDAAFGFCRWPDFELVIVFRDRWSRTIGIGKTRCLPSGNNRVTCEVVNEQYAPATCLSAPADSASWQKQPLKSQVEFRVQQLAQATELLERADWRVDANSATVINPNDTWTKLGVLTPRWRAVVKLSTMAIDRLEIVIQGSGPYGFRLAGGDGRPLTVTKVICGFVFFLDNSRCIIFLPSARRKFHLAAI